MQQTTNYNLNKFDSTDELESATRLGLNENADTIDTALKGIQDDIDGLDASEVSYDNTVSGLTATDVQAALDEELGKIDILSTDYIVEQGTSGDWTYRKWNSGIAECWGTQNNFTQSNFPTAWGGGYYGAKQTNNVFPTGLFISVPTLLASNLSGDGVWFSFVDLTSQSFAYYPYCTNTGTRSYRLMVHAIGTWK